MMALGKLKHEQEQLSSAAKSNSFRTNLNAYLFDKWNYIDLGVLVSLFVYLLISTLSWIITILGLSEEYAPVTLRSTPRNIQKRRF